MATLAVPGATLYYETEGSGTPFILIPGANGDGFIFKPMAKILSEKYLVVRPDRRGYSRSVLDAPFSADYHDKDSRQKLKDDANDIALLVEHLGAGPAVIFGSSSGAQVALQTLIDHHGCVKTLLCHEVPLLRLFPDFEEWEKRFLGLYDIFVEKGAAAAMAVFAGAIAAGDDTEKFEHATDEEQSPYMAANMDFWFEYELRQYSRYPMDVDGIGRGKDKLTLLTGEDSGGKMPAIANQYFSDKFGLPITITPNSHFGYQERPADFAAVLLQSLANGGEK